MTYEAFIQRYQYSPKTDRLGEGGFGKVYRAFDNHLDRYVALKIAEVKEDQPAFRLKQEVEIAAKLPTHANVARYEACYTYETPTGTFDFAILQYYEEGNLLKLINENSLSDQQKFEIIGKILLGIQFLHENNIIHRDLKPQNILVARRGDMFIPKISDFGISKQISAEAESWVSNSLTGGSIAYASPEQLKGAKFIQKNTDLWSMGVLIYQNITDELPFNTGVYESGSEQGRMEMARQITEGVVPAKIRELTFPYRQIIQRCLVVDPAQRIKTAGELLGILNGKEDDIQPEKPSEKPAILSYTGETELFTPSSAPAKPVSPTPGSAPHTPDQAGSNEVKDDKIKPTRNTDKPSENPDRRYSWIVRIAGIAIVAGFIIGLFWLFNQGPTDKEVEEKRIADSTRVADSLAIVQAEQRRIADAIIKVMNFEMIYIEGGTFQMGSNDVYSDGTPVHQVTVNSFYIGKYEVTQNQWESVMGNNPSYFSDCGNCPVEQVSWNDVQEFIRKLNINTGKGYRLPTEAEWEFAARGGNMSKGNKFAGTNDGSQLYRFTNFCDASCEYEWKTNSQNDGYRNTAPVGKFLPNELGIYDMSGNVWEWCADWYDANYYYANSPANNPENTTTKWGRVVRGGSWWDFPSHCRVSYRDGYMPDHRRIILGFRLLRRE